MFHGLGMIRLSVLAAVFWALVSVPAMAGEHVGFSILQSASDLPFLYAYDHRLFQAEGIDPEFFVLGAPNQVIDSLVTGRADVAPGAAAGIALVADSQFPNILKIFGLSGGQIDPLIRGDALVVPRTSSFSSLADLKGKKIGTLPGIQWRSITRFLLKKGGLDPARDAQIVEIALPLQVQALLAGTVDALLVTEPNVSLSLATGTVKVAVEEPAGRYIGSPFFTGALAMTSKFANGRPDVARKVVKILYEATKVIDAQFEENRPLLAKYHIYSEDALPNIPKTMTILEPDFTKDDLDSYQKFSDMFMEEGAMEEPVDVRKQLLPVDYMPK